MDANSIGRKIFTLRKERGLTQEGLAEALDISPQAVSKWENGHALPETALLPGLARALDTSIDSLLTDSRLQILTAFYGDGLERCSVANRLNRLIENDALTLTVSASALGCSLENNRPNYLIVKYQLGEELLCAFAEEGAQLTIDSGSKGYGFPDEPEICAASYGTKSLKYDVLHKIEHYKAFSRTEYSADHETFPSDPMNDEKDFLTLVYVNKTGIHLVTCEEGERIVYSVDQGGVFIRKTGNEHFIKGVPELPEFGKGMDCSWAAALTAALQAMNIPATYAQVMGVSGACFRLAFSSPVWDYSSADGLVAYDYATPGYLAFGYQPKFADRIDKKNRAEERERILASLRCGMPVLGINLRVAAEWGVICGYRNNGADLFCRTKYDRAVVDAPGFQWKQGAENPHDYLLVDTWPFILTYFEPIKAKPTERENLLTALRVFVDCARQETGRGYAMGLNAYAVWSRDLLEESFYQSCDDALLLHRFSVNQFCALALNDARSAAYAYLNSCKTLLPGKENRMEKLTALFSDIAASAERLHRMLSSAGAPDGAEARLIWTKKLREAQAAHLREMADLERSALTVAEELLSFSRL